MVIEDLQETHQPSIRTKWTSSEIQRTLMTAAEGMERELGKNKNGRVKEGARKPQSTQGVSLQERLSQLKEDKGRDKKEPVLNFWETLHIIRISLAIVVVLHLIAGAYGQTIMMVPEKADMQLCQPVQVYANMSGFSDLLARGDAEKWLSATIKTTVTQKPFPLPFYLDYLMMWIAPQQNVGNFTQANITASFVDGRFPDTEYSISIGVIRLAPSNVKINVGCGVAMCNNLGWPVQHCVEGTNPSAYKCDPLMLGLGMVDPTGDSSGIVFPVSLPQQPAATGCVSSGYTDAGTPYCSKMNMTLARTFDSNQLVFLKASGHDTSNPNNFIKMSIMATCARIPEGGVPSMINVTTYTPVVSLSQALIDLLNKTQARVKFGVGSWFGGIVDTIMDGIFGGSDDDRVDKIEEKVDESLKISERNTEAIEKLIDALANITVDMNNRFEDLKDIINYNTFELENKINIMNVQAEQERLLRARDDAQIVSYANAQAALNNMRVRGMTAVIDIIRATLQLGTQNVSPGDFMVMAAADAVIAQYKLGKYPSNLSPGGFGENVTSPMLMGLTFKVVRMSHGTTILIINVPLCHTGVSLKAFKVINVQPAYQMVGHGLAVQSSLGKQKAAGLCVQMTNTSSPGDLGALYLPVPYENGVSRTDIVSPTPHPWMEYDVDGTPIPLDVCMSSVTDSRILSFDGDVGDSSGWTVRFFTGRPNSVSSPDLVPMAVSLVKFSPCGYIAVSPPETMSVSASYPGGVTVVSTGRLLVVAEAGKYVTMSIKLLNRTSSTRECPQNMPCVPYAVVSENRNLTCLDTSPGDFTMEIEYGSFSQQIVNLGEVTLNISDSAGYLPDIDWRGYQMETAKSSNTSQQILDELAEAKRDNDITKQMIEDAKAIDTSASKCSMFNMGPCGIWQTIQYVFLWCVIVVAAGFALRFLWTMYVTAASKQPAAKPQAIGGTPAKRSGGRKGSYELLPALIVMLKLSACMAQVPYQCSGVGGTVSYYSLPYLPRASTPNYAVMNMLLESASQGLSCQTCPDTQTSTRAQSITTTTTPQPVPSTSQGISSTSGDLNNTTTGLLISSTSTSSSTSSAVAVHTIKAPQATTAGTEPKFSEPTQAVTEQPLCVCPGGNNAQNQSETYASSRIEESSKSGAALGLWIVLGTLVVSLVGAAGTILIRRYRRSKTLPDNDNGKCRHEETKPNSEEQEAIYEIPSGRDEDGFMESNDISQFTSDGSSVYDNVVRPTVRRIRQCGSSRSVSPSTSAMAIAMATIITGATAAPLFGLSAGNGTLANTTTTTTTQPWNINYTSTTQIITTTTPVPLPANWTQTCGGVEEELSCSKRNCTYMPVASSYHVVACCPIPVEPCGLESLGNCKTSESFFIVMQIITTVVTWTFSAGLAILITRKVARNKAQSTRRQFIDVLKEGYMVSPLTKEYTVFSRSDKPVLNKNGKPTSSNWSKLFSGKMYLVLCDDLSMRIAMKVDARDTYAVDTQGRQWGSPVHTVGAGILCILGNGVKITSTFSTEPIPVESLEIAGVFLSEGASKKMGITAAERTVFSEKPGHGAGTVSQVLAWGFAMNLIPTAAAGSSVMQFRDGCNMGSYSGDCCTPGEVRFYDLMWIQVAGWITLILLYLVFRVQDWQRVLTRGNIASKIMIGTLLGYIGGAEATDVIASSTYVVNFWDDPECSLFNLPACSTAKQAIYVIFMIGSVAAMLLILCILRKTCQCMGLVVELLDWIKSWFRRKAKDEVLQDVKRTMDQDGTTQAVNFVLGMRGMMEFFERQNNLAKNVQQAG